MGKNIVFFIVLLLSFSACSKIPTTTIVVKGNLNQGDSVVVDFFLESQQYRYGGSCSVTKEMAEKSEAIISTPHDFSRNILGFNLSFFIKEDRILHISSITAKPISTISAKEILDGMWWQQNANFKFDTISNNISSEVSKDIPVLFSNSIYPFYAKRYHNVVNIASICFIVFSLILVFLLFRSTKYKNLLAPILLLYLICLPLKISWSNWILLVLGLTSLALFIKNKERKFNFNPVFWGAIGVFVIYLIGVLYSNNMKDSLGGLSSLLAIVPITIIFSLVSVNKEDIRLVFLFFTRYISLYSIYLIFCFIFAIPALGLSSIADALANAREIHGYLFPYPSFHHPSFISIIISMAIPIAIYLKIERNTTWIETLLPIILAIIVILLSGSRIGLIVIPLLLSLSFLYYAKVSQHIKYSLVVVGMSTILLILFILPSSKNIFNDSTRKDQRATAIAAIKEKPLFGWGTDSMETLLHNEAIAQKAGLEEPIRQYNHFHNQYLDMLVQFGFIGAIPFFALFVYLVYLAIKRKDFLLMSYLAIYIPFMYVESPFATVKGIQPMIFWLCFLLSTQKARLEGKMLPSNTDELNKNKAL